MSAGRTGASTSHMFYLHPAFYKIENIHFYRFLVVPNNITSPTKTAIDSVTCFTSYMRVGTSFFRVFRRQSHPENTSVSVRVRFDKNVRKCRLYGKKYLKNRVLQKCPPTVTVFFQKRYDFFIFLLGRFFIVGMTNAVIEGRNSWFEFFRCFY